MIANPYSGADWNAVVPLSIVAVAALVVLFADLVTPKGLAKRWVPVAISAIGLAGAAFTCGEGWGHSYAAFGGGFMVGGFATVFQEIVIVAALLSVAIYAHVGEDENFSGGLALLLWSTSGAMLMAGAGSLMTIFLGLELLSLALYCLCGLSPRATAGEAALKYLILSSAASGFMLYGMALFFGATGSVALAALAGQAVESNALFLCGTALFLIGIAFKLSLVPFHVWVPDVFQGAPLPVTAFMSVVTKAATLAVFARFAYAAVTGPHAQAILAPVYVIAGISMIVGNLGALAQTDMKRLLAYSGIAQVGYIVAALAGSTALGLRYAIFYLAAYTFMNIGAFLVVALLSTSKEEGSALAAYRGLGRTRPVLAAAMVLFLLALAGLPPTAGFVGKILILSANFDAGYAWLAGLLIAGTAISLYVYFKIVGLMYGRHERPHPTEVRPVAPLAWAGLVACVLFTFVWTFDPLGPSNVLPLVK
ncbi:MAG: NADH-quinone oxidoreductase subunit N [Candidatus Eremiobacteraeota bacterium]|nr:NADH-quinone oxidoreductase subunit N [Candidatus Eremiobacteraeota bacterium]